MKKNALPTRVTNTAVGHAEHEGARDITECREVEEALRENEERFRSLVETISDWVWEIDRNGIYTYVSPKVKELLGYEPEEVVGKTPFDLMSEDEAERVGEMFREKVESREPISGLENTNLHKDGHHVVLETSGAPFFDADGNLLGYRGIDRDITERKRAEEAIKNAAEEWRATFDSMPDMVMLIDQDYRITRVNRAVIKALGISFHDVLGKHCFEYIHGCDAPHESCVHGQVMADGREHTIEMYEPNLNGHFYVTATPVFDDSGAVIGSVHIMRDITERKQAEDLKARLIQSDRLAAIGQLAAGVAHEINNPLGYIFSNLSSLQEYMGDVKKYLKHVRPLIETSLESDDKLSKETAARVESVGEELRIEEIIDDIGPLTAECIEGAKRTKEIVINLKNFSRPGESKPVLANINEGIESTLSVALSEIKYRAKIHKELGDLPLIYCYPQQLNQVILNLLMNAVHAMKEHGNMWIRTREQNGVIEIEVEDEGEGIPPENISRVFDPFFTTKPVGKGTGLGLSISYGIVKKHNGKILVDSEPGKGSKFTVRIPKEGVVRDDKREEKVE